MLKYKYNKINNENNKIIKIKVLMDPKLNRYGYIKIEFVYNQIYAWLEYEYNNWFYCNYIYYSSGLGDITEMTSYNENDDLFDKFVEYIMNNWNSGKYSERLSYLNKEISKYFAK